MNRTYHKIVRNRKNRIARRLAPKNWEDQPEPMLKASNIHYEMADRVQGVNCGGIGAMHMLTQRIGLVKDIDRNLELLKVHLPYHESDHVLNIAYNILVGGVRLEDIELRRQDENFLNGLGAQRIPDPTTAGDFTRRFDEDDIFSLQECFNRARVSGTVTIRGDTDFSHTEQLDRWDKKGNKFILVFDAHPKLVKIADALVQSAWRPMERLPKHEILSEPRKKAFRFKEQIVIEKEFKNQKLVGEDITEIDYQPLKCKTKYRVIILRKNISVQQGEKVLLDEIKYFFYITNRPDKGEKIVGLANGRCDQENVIEQLKNGVNAMRMPVRDLVSNWAYMVMATLAWNLKSWYGQLTPNRERGLELVKMEFRRFLNAIMLIPCQIVRTARRVIYRILGYNSWLTDFFETWERLQKLKLVE